MNAKTKSIADAQPPNMAALAAIVATCWTTERRSPRSEVSRGSQAVLLRSCASPRITAPASRTRPHLRSAGGMICCRSDIGMQRRAHPFRGGLDGAIPGVDVMRSARSSYLALLLFLLVLIGHLHAEPLPYPKPRDGQCAGSYVQSGGFCVSKSGQVRDAIPKPQDGQCPAGWSSSGSSCEKMR